MRVRIFSGSRWSGAAVLGDFTFDVLPQTGHKLALASEAGWDAGTVLDIAHRIVDTEDAADIAVLLSPVIDGGDGDDPLPLAAFDRLDGAPAAAATAVPRAGGPWGGR